MKKIMVIAGIICLLFLAGCHKEDYMDGGHGVDHHEEEVSEEDYLLDQEILESAKKESNAEYCDIIQTTRIKDLCYQYVAVDTEDVNVCAKISDEESVTGCQMQIVVLRLDYEGCEEIQSDLHRNLCLFQVGTQTNEPVHCVKIDEDVYRDDCYDTIARQTEQASLCDNVVSLEKQSKCNFDIAIETQNPEICEKFTFNGDPIVKDACLSSIASRSKNPSVCEKITINEIKESCLSRLTE